MQNLRIWFLLNFILEHAKFMSVQKIKNISDMKKHFVDNHASCDKGKDVIQHLKIDLESLSEVIIKSYFISEL